MDIDPGDIQSLVARPPKATIVRHLIFAFDETEEARTFVRELLPMVAMGDAQVGASTDVSAHVGFTFGGLAALGVAPEVLEELDAAYEEGPDGHALGDVPGSRSDPATWWEGQFRTEDVHCMVQLYSSSDEALDAATATVRASASRGGLTELIPRRDGTVLEGRSLGGGTLHFGYTDGISHPDVRWKDNADTPGRVDFRMFVLGYATAEFSSAPRSGPAADLVRGSTYAAFRWIYQDVAAFAAFLRTQGPRLYPNLTPADAEERLAAKLMGRWRDGTPLVISPDHPDPAQAAANDFGYAAQDPDGRACPFSAHIRVVNPRDQALEPVADAVPIVLRRGMPYGPPLTEDEDDGIDRGLLGVFLCTDLRRQIYTMTGWIQRNDFSPVYNANRRVQDALVANRSLPGAVTDFPLPGEGPNGEAAAVRALPDFVHTKGTLFFLYPGRAMLQTLAAGGR